MSTLLQINASIFSDQGQSSRLANHFVGEWKTRHPDGEVVRRDLAVAPLPHLDAALVQAFSTPADARSTDQQALVAVSDQLIRELQQAEVIVLGVPMYNFGIPSTLKAYFDRIARAGITFRYSQDGPQGLLTDKQVYVMCARGGRYEGTPLDTQTAYLKEILSFLGMTAIEFVYVGGLNMSATDHEAVWAEATQRIAELLA